MVNGLFGNPSGFSIACTIEAIGAPTTKEIIMVKNRHFLILPPPLKRLPVFRQSHHGLDTILELLCCVSGNALKNKKTPPMYAR
jgi:hypothetical protein